VASSVTFFDFVIFLYVGVVETMCDAFSMTSSAVVMSSFDTLPRCRQDVGLPSASKRLK
jgi:hypothetical protein